MKRYKVKKVFRDARSNEIYGAGVLISLTDERHAEIVAAIGDDFLDVVPENPEQTHEIVAVAVEKATAPLKEEIESLKARLEKQEVEDGDGDPIAQGSENTNDNDFPKMLSRGKYELSNGETFEGNKDAAVEAEKALEE